MERVQAAVASSATESSAACVSCHSAVDGPRCAHCGAAQVAGGYRALRVIAQTAHSRMYLAEDGQGRKVALKELMFALVPGVEQLAAFEREAAVLRNLTHSQIPAFVRAFTEGTGVGTRLYLAQEFIEGESLQQRVARQRLTEDEAWTLAEQALEVLHHLHTRDPRLVHRDVKPANLILRERERGPLALVDFGAVRDLARELTHGSTLVGTFGYMPPEQLGGTVDPTSDLYALGATLLHGLTGIPPSDLLVDGLELRFEDKIPFVSAELRDFLKKLAAPRRSARFPSAQAALEVLRARGQTVLRPDAVERAKKAQAQRGPGSQKKAAVIAFLVFGVALLAGLGVLAFSHWQASHSLVAPGAGDDTHIDRTGQVVPASFEPSFQVAQDLTQHDHVWHEERGIQVRVERGDQAALPLQGVASAVSDDPGVARILPSREVLGVSRGHVRVVVQLEGGRQAVVFVTVE